MVHACMHKGSAKGRCLRIPAKRRLTDTAELNGLQTLRKRDINYGVVMYEKIDSMKKILAQRTDQA